LAYPSIFVELSFVDFSEGVVVYAGADLLVDEAVDVFFDYLYVLMEDFRCDVADGFDEVDLLCADHFVYLLVESQYYQGVFVFFYVYEFSHEGMHVVLKVFGVQGVVDELFVKELAVKRIPVDFLG
jgi:hypothetical protein